MGEGPLGFEEGDEDAARAGHETRARERAAAQAREDAAEQAASTPGPARRSRGARTLSSTGPRVGRSGWIALLIGVLILGYITVNTLRTKGPGSLGPPVGSLAAPFAAPTAAGQLKGAVNVATKAGQGKAKVAACDIHRPDVVTSCDVWGKRPTVLVFFATREASGCVKELDRVEQVARRERGVAFIAITIKGDRGEIRRLAADRGWTFPVAYDQYAVLSNLYGVAVCPALTYVRKGGRIAGSDFGTISTPRLQQQVSRLARGRPLDIKT